MARMLYNLASRHGRIFPVSSTVLGGTLVSGSLAANTSDDDLMTMTAITGFQLLIEFDLGSALAVEMIYVLNHNLKDSTSIIIGANTTSNNWGAPAATVTMTRTTDALAPFSRYYNQPWMDVSAELTNTAYRYWSLQAGALGGGDVNDVPIKIGEIVLLGATASALPHNPSWNLREVRLDDGQLVHRTPGGMKWVKKRGGYRRQLVGTIETNAAGAAALDNIADSCTGESRPFYLIPDPAKRDVRLVDWARHEKTYIEGNNFTVPIEWTEVARGDECLVD